MREEYAQHGAMSAEKRKGMSRSGSLTADFGLIWRKRPASDVGIDGQPEFVTADGSATFFGNGDAGSGRPNPSNRGLRFGRLPPARHSDATLRPGPRQSSRPAERPLPEHVTNCRARIGTAWGSNAKRGQIPPCSYRSHLRPGTMLPR